LLSNISDENIICICLIAEPILSLTFCEHLSTVYHAIHKMKKKKKLSVENMQLFILTAIQITFHSQLGKE
jgi:hypothetical protein